MPRCTFSGRFLVGGIDKLRIDEFRLAAEAEAEVRSPQTRYGGADHGNPDNRKSVKRIEGFQIKRLDGIPNVERTAGGAGICGALGLLTTKILTSLKIVIPRAHGRDKSDYSTACSTDSRFSNSSLLRRER